MTRMLRLVTNQLIITDTDKSLVFVQLTKGTGCFFECSDNTFRPEFNLN
jgi:hypothetical protein